MKPRGKCEVWSTAIMCKCVNAQYKANADFFCLNQNEKETDLVMRDQKNAAVPINSTQFIRLYTCIKIEWTLAISSQFFRKITIFCCFWFMSVKSHQIQHQWHNPLRIVVKVFFWGDWKSLPFFGGGVTRQDYVTWFIYQCRYIIRKQCTCAVVHMKKEIISTADFIVLLCKCAGAEIHSFRSHIRDHFVLDWKSTLKLVESTLKNDTNHYFGADYSMNWEWILLQMKWSLIWLQKEWISTPLH